MNRHLVRYITEDVDAAVEFYTAHLDFEVEMHPAPGFAMLTNGDLVLTLNAPGAGSAGKATEQAGRTSPGWNRFQLVVDDLDATVAGLDEAGVSLASEIVHGGGGRACLVTDPGGNLVELFQAAD